MSRPFAILIGLGGLSLTAGCADIMQQSAVSQIAPGWFAEKAIEVKGEGPEQIARFVERATGRGRQPTGTDRGVDDRGEGAGGAEGEGEKGDD